MHRLRRFAPDDASALTSLLHRAYAEHAALGLNFTAVDQDEDETLRRAQSGVTWVVDSGEALTAAITISTPPSVLLQELTVCARAPQRMAQPACRRSRAPRSRLGGRPA